MKKLVVLTGAGISAESGIPTFRDADGLWEGYDVMEVASPEGWQRNPELVLNFYNERRRAVQKALPNKAHLLLNDLEEFFDVTIITQNIDDLHERAGSGHVLHLHGEIMKARSSADESLLYPCEGDISLGDTCSKGTQLRPHVVWFGEMVPMIEPAMAQVQEADVFLVVGTSLQVYPAAGLIQYVRPHTPCFIVDPKTPASQSLDHMTILQQKAVEGMEALFPTLRGLC